MKTSEPKEPKASRKQPERNPVRLLFSERARLQFEDTEYDKKVFLENNRHASRVKELEDAKSARGLRLTEIEKEIEALKGAK